MFEEEFETVMIFAPDISYDSIYSRLMDLLHRLHISIVSMDHQGLKELAYNIKDYTIGRYIILTFRAGAYKLNKLENAMKTMNEILKYMTIKKEYDNFNIVMDEPISYNKIREERYLE